VTALIDGEIDLEEAIRRLATRTRRYAKRQRTWMRKLPALVPLDASPPPAAVAAEVASLL
jgi:tRNA A37 N6-isopentenylltransferase MiaA